MNVPDVRGDRDRDLPQVLEAMEFEPVLPLQRKVAMRGDRDVLSETTCDPHWHALFEPRLPRLRDLVAERGVVRRPIAVQGLDLV